MTPPGATPAGPPEPGAEGTPSAAPGPISADGWAEVRRRMRDVEARLRKGRLTVPTYLAATAFFLTMGVVTGNWPPAAVLAGLCLLAAWTVHRIRRRRMEQLRALAELEASLPRGAGEPEQQAGKGPAAGDRDP